MKRIAATLSSVALVAGVWVPATGASTSAPTEPVGLWSTDFTAGQTASDCGEHRLDNLGFCVANDARNGLEVGVKFQSSTDLTITGIRIYRVDQAELRASLWDSTGNLLARVNFAENGGEGWQDATFAAPVAIAPGTTYVASYFTPATKYAFGYEYFADQGLTVGPVTAPPSTADDPNGVHCYEDAACGSFPVRDYRSSTYWVTPLWQATDGPPPGSPPGAPTVDQEPPRVIGGGPARGAQGVKAAAAKVKVRFSEPVRRDTLTRRTVRLLVGAKATLVKVRLRYDADRERVVLTPRKPLRSATTYRVQVTTGVRDVAGNRLDQMPKKAGLQKATWTFRTR